MKLAIGIGLILLGLASPGAPWRQSAPQAPTPAIFSDLERAWLDNVALANQLAVVQCQALESAKQFNALRAEVLQKIEARHPGFTVDWQKQELVPKRAQK